MTIYGSNCFIFNLLSKYLHRVQELSQEFWNCEDWMQPEKRQIVFMKNDEDKFIQIDYVI